MQKQVYILWKKPEDLRADFCQQILHEATPALQARDAVQAVQVNVADERISAAEAMVQKSGEDRPYGMICLWLGDDDPEIRTILHTHCARADGFIVREDTPLPGAKYLPETGKRAPGFSQIALLQKPDELSYQEWLDIWLKSHGEIAVRTQSTWLYVRNIVERALDENAPAYSGIVEEAFPSAAMESQEVFYDAKGDPQKLADRQKEMMMSCARFIDFKKIDVFFTSRYLFE